MVGLPSHIESSRRCRLWALDGHFDRIATHILAFEGDSHVEWFEGNFQDYEANKMRRRGHGL